MKLGLNINTIVAVIAIAYLANLGFGIVELIPDNAPLIGNLDEVVATYVALRGLGIK